MLELPRLLWQALSGELVTPRILLERVVAEFAARYDRDPAILDWDTGLQIATAFPHLAVFSPPIAGDSLPYLDRSVDIVVLRQAEAAKLPDALRVASGV